MSKRVEISIGYPAVRAVWKRSYARPRDHTIAWHSGRRKTCLATKSVAVSIAPPPAGSRSIDARSRWASASHTSYSHRLRYRGIDGEALDGGYPAEAATPGLKFKLHQGPLLSVNRCTCRASPVVGSVTNSGQGYQHPSIGSQKSSGR